MGKESTQGYQFTMENGRSLLVDIKYSIEDVLDFDVETIMAQCQALDGQLMWVNARHAHTDQSWSAFCEEIAEHIEAIILKEALARAEARHAARPQLRLVK